MKPIQCVLLSLLAVWFGMACVNVQPFEREYLADPIMSIVDDPQEEAYNQHMHRALSQGLTSFGAGGSGCGCEQ